LHKDFELKGLVGGSCEELVGVSEFGSKKRWV